MTPGMIAIFDLDLNEGRMLTESDVDRRSNIAIIGMDVVENLMPGIDPVKLVSDIDEQADLNRLGRTDGKT